MGHMFEATKQQANQSGTAMDFTGEMNGQPKTTLEQSVRAELREAGLSWNAAGQVGQGLTEMTDLVEASCTTQTLV